MLRVLALGDVLSPATVEFLCRRLWQFRRENKVDFTVVNGENAGFLSGIGSKDASLLLDGGADCITGGNHTMAAKSIYSTLESSDRVLRPINLADGVPGTGYTILPARDRRILVFSALGCLFMEAGTPDPVPYIERVLAREAGRYDLSVLDLHAEATGEKIAAAFRLDGKVSAIYGTHTHVPTADETVLPMGTGYVSDVGFCGRTGGVLGVKAEVMTARQRTRLRYSYSEAEGPFRAQGALFDLDEATGKTLAVRRVEFGE